MPLLYQLSVAVVCEEGGRGRIWCLYLYNILPAGVRGVFALILVSSCTSCDRERPFTCTCLLLRYTAQCQLTDRTSYVVIQIEIPKLSLRLRPHIRFYYFLSLEPVDHPTIIYPRPLFLENTQTDK
jgi:hypothetical protein